MVIRVKMLTKESAMPAYACAGDAGLDLFAREDVAIEKGACVQVPTGVAFEIPEGHAGLIWDKSGLSHRHGLKTVGGVIDAGFRGEVMVGVINLGKEDYTLRRGEKVAQMLIQKVEQVNLEEVAELKDSSRGARGFGSSGA